MTPDMLDPRVDPDPDESQQSMWIWSPPVFNASDNRWDMIKLFNR